MNREFHRWFSPTLQREMDLLVFGHAGARLLIFPTSKGRFYEWEDRGMIGVLADQIEAGQLQVYCVDSVDEESWYAWWKHPGSRAWRQTEYDRYLCDEVLPMTRAKNPDMTLITLGASFGAYHALNFALRHPELVGRAIGLSGVYDISYWASDFAGGDVYYQNPVAYMANESDPGRLAALQRMDIILAVGRDDRLREQSERLSGVLWNRGIGNALRLWDGWSHDWPYWTQMIRQYIGGHD